TEWISGPIGPLICRPGLRWAFSLDSEIANLSTRIISEGDVYMDTILTPQQQRDFLQRGFSRRQLARIATLITAGGSLPFFSEPALAQLSAVKGPIPEDAVKIDANENPLGPCETARQAIQSIIPRGGRYLYNETDTMVQTLAEQEGLKPEYIRPYPGSSAP